MSYRLILGDCREVMAGMDEGSVDAIVTDPPYGLEFMGKGWDRGVPGLEFWSAALRVAKPGAHLVAFGGTRTFHRLACAIEDAGWEIRDCLSWLYGQGFPKSLDVSRAIDKAAGLTRERIPHSPGTGFGSGSTVAYAQDAWTTANSNTLADPRPLTPEAEPWSGWGTALKPAWEPIILARKPLAGTVAANVLEHGTGALNVDGCRIAAPAGDREEYGIDRDESAGRNRFAYSPHNADRLPYHRPKAGRWPANVVLDEEAAAMLDAQSGEQKDGTSVNRNRDGGNHNHVYGAYAKPPRPDWTYGGSGGASRFFYTAKATSGERHYAGKNHHPTVKPVDLMRWLCRLVTPPGGLIVDPFMGSGSTGIAALAEGFCFTGIEKEQAYLEIARKRIAGPLFAPEATA